MRSAFVLVSLDLQKIHSQCWKSVHDGLPVFSSFLFCLETTRKAWLASVFDILFGSQYSTNTTTLVSVQPKHKRKSTVVHLHKTRRDKIYTFIGDIKLLYGDVWESPFERVSLVCAFVLFPLLRWKQEPRILGFVPQVRLQRQL